jgi:hypothetical protein
MGNFCIFYPLGCLALLFFVSWRAVSSACFFIFFVSLGCLVYLFFDVVAGCLVGLFFIFFVSLGCLVYLFFDVVAGCLVGFFFIFFVSLGCLVLLYFVVKSAISSSYFYYLLPCSKPKFYGANAPLESYFPQIFNYPPSKSTIKYYLLLFFSWFFSCDERLDVRCAAVR